MGKWSKTITTSPSGFHLGHYTTVFVPHCWSFDHNSKEKINLDQQQSDILNFHLQLLNLILRQGVSLQ
jgi:hypothetical protein